MRRPEDRVAAVLMVVIFVFVAIVIYLQRHPKADGTGAIEVVPEGIYLSRPDLEQSTVEVAELRAKNMALLTARESMWEEINRLQVRLVVLERHAAIERAYWRALAREGLTQRITHERSAP